MTGDHDDGRLFALMKDESGPTSLPDKPPKPAFRPARRHATVDRPASHRNGSAAAHEAATALSNTLEKSFTLR
jgi:hypothetical protein